MPWWGKPSESKDSKTEQKPSQDANNNSTQAPFDPDKIPKAQKLPAGLQKIVDKSDKDSSFFDNVAEG